MPKCRICGSTSINKKHRLGHYSYYLCSSCKTLFLNPMPKAKEMDFYYQSKFTYDVGRVEERRTKIKAGKILDTLRLIRPWAHTLLDIGSGFGFFLSEAQKQEYDVTGVEPSKALYAYSKRYLKAHMINTDFQSFLEINKNHYDIITLIHVIEHLPDPRQTLEQIFGLLKPGGLLYIETPNLDSHLYETEQGQYTFLTPPDHLWIFSQYSIRELLKNMKGVSIAKISTSTHPEHFMGILKRTLQITNNKHQINDKSSITNIRTKSKKTQSSIREIKYLLLDKLLAPLMSPLLNINQKGSILELYITKA